MLKVLLIGCGVGHICLALGSLAIPKMLNWRQTLKAVPKLIEQIFWTYAGYILSINVFFGIISILFPDELLSGSGLGNSLLTLITLYWLSRLVIQFVYFDRTSVPATGLYKFGEFALVALFVMFTVIYGYAAICSL